MRGLFEAGRRLPCRGFERLCRHRVGVPPQQLPQALGLLAQSLHLGGQPIVAGGELGLPAGDLVRVEPDLVESEPAPGGVRVSIRHDLALGWPLIGGLAAERIIGPLFVANIAGKTLRRIKALAEARTAEGSAERSRPALPK